MEPQSLANGFQWVGIAFGGLFGAIGLGGIILFGLRRFFGQRDRQGKIHETNQGEQIRSDTEFRRDLIKRVDKLQYKIDSLQAEMNSQMIENIRLAAENAWLKKDNERLEMEINDLRTSCHESDITISALRGEVDALKIIVQRHEQPVMDLTEPIDVRLVDGEGNDAKLKEGKIK